MLDHKQNRLEGLSFTQILQLSNSEKEKYGLLHTPQEVYQQPETWLETFQIFKNNAEALKQFLHENDCDKTDRGNLRLTLIGAGTSDYIGRALVGLLRKQWKCEVEAMSSTDLLTEIHDFVADAPPQTKHLWISFSRSGDSFEGLKVIQKALSEYPQISHLIITCNENGKMAGELCRQNANVFCLTLDKKVNDLGLAMTSSFTNMIVAGQCLAHLDDLNEYEKIVETLSRIASGKISEISEIAQKISAIYFTRICFLGSGALKSVGAESGLKVMELTGGHFSIMSESFLGLRHGPLSWLNNESLVVAFISNDIERSQLEIGLIEEVKRKNAAKNILAILPNKNIDLETDFSLCLDIPEFLTDNYRPPVDVLFAQCLGIFASLRCNLKPDAPSADGKIQRVVSQIS